MAEANDKSQSTHQSPNIGNSGGSTRLLNNARNIDVGHHHTTGHLLAVFVQRPAGASGGGGGGGGGVAVAVRR